MVAGGAWSGWVIADRAAGWRAFHGLVAPAVPESFTVTGISSSRRGAKTLDLVGASGAPSISIGRGTQDCRSLDAGDRPLVRVETAAAAPGVRRSRRP